MSIWQVLAGMGAPKKTTYTPMSNRQLEANGVPYKKKAPAKPKPKPKPIISTPAARRSSYVLPTGSGGGGGVSLPVLPGSSGSMAMSPVSTAALLSQLKKQAHDQVSMELDPQINAQVFARGAATRSHAAELAAIKKQLGLTKTELTQLYGALNVMLQSNAKKTQAALDVGKGQAASAYDQLQTLVGNTYSSAGGNLQAELTRLGQSGGDATAKLAADQAFTTGQVGAQKANATSTIDAIKAATAGEASALQGAAAATAPALIGQAQIGADTAITKLNTDYNETLRQIKFSISQLSGSRKVKEAAALRELQAAQAQAEQDAAQLQFLNGVKVAQLGISQGQLDLAKQRLGYDVQNQQANLVLKAKELQAKLAGPAAKPQTGMEKAYTYLKSYKGRVPQNQLQAALEDAINGNSNDPDWHPGVGIPGYDPKYMDQYKRDISMAVSQRGWTTAERQALLNAVNYYFGK